MDHPLRILLLSELANDGELVSRPLRDAGLTFTLKRVESREAFLKELRESAPDVVLSEYATAGLRATEALRSLRETAPGTPFIVVTGETDEEVAVECMKAGACDFVIKPHIGRLALAIRDTGHRQQMAEALRLSEMCYRALAEEAHDMIFSVDPEGRVGYVNTATARQFGRDPRAIVGKPIEELFPPSEAEQYRQNIRKVFEHGEALYAEGRVTFPGRELWLSTWLVPIHGRNRRVDAVLGVSRDITGRKVVEENLQRLEAEESAVLDSLSENVVHLDPDMRIVWVNKTASKGARQSPHEMAGRYCYELWQHRDKPCPKCPAAKALQTGQPERAEVVTPDGKFWAISGSVLKDREGHIVGVVEVSQEITERKQAEKTLRDSESRYRTTFESTGTAMAIDDEDTIIHLVNSEFEQLSGYSREELEGRMSWTTFIPKEDLARIKEYHDQRRIDPSRAPKNYECRFIRKDGSLRDVYITTALVGGTQRTVASLVDITDRKAMEQALAAERDLLHSLMESSSDKIYFKDANGRFFQVNRATAKAHGFADPLQMAGKTDFDFFTPEYARDTLEHEREIMRTGRPLANRVEKETWADGKVTWVSTVKAPLHNKEGKIIGTFGITRNITRQKEDEAALRRRLDFENLIAAVSTDFINLPPQGIDKGISEALELVGKFAGADRSYIFLRSEDRQTVSNTHEWCAEGIASQRHRLKDLPAEHFPWLKERLERYETVRVPRVADLPEEARAEKEAFARQSIQSFMSIPMLYGGSLIGFLGLDAVRTERKWGGEIVALLKFVGEIFVNALERKWVEEELARERNLLRALMDNIPDRIYFKDRASRFIRVNKAMTARHSATDPSQLVGKTDFDVFLDEHARQAYADEQEVMRTGAPIIGKEEKETWPDGTISWASTTKMPLRDKDGDIIGTFGVSRDITERKMAGEAMLHAQKLESLGVLAGGIAHDFNNLLAVVLGNTELALCKLPSDSPVRGFLNQVKVASQRGAELCKQMLSYAGKGFVSMQVLDLNGIVQEITELLQISVSKQAALRYNLQPSLPAVQVDSAQIRQVIMNLVINASEAIGDEKGTITISTGAMPASRAFLRGTFVETEAPEGEYVYLEVADSGCGMDEKTLRRIFDPFFTTKFTGRGLGLAAVLGILQGHHAALKVNSEKGAGTVFRLLLPPVQAPRGPAPVEPATEPAWCGTGAVLIIDDEDHVRSVAARMIEVLGFSSLSASNGMEAIEIYRAHQANITLVVLDMTMPQMSGEETFQELWRINPEVRVLLISGYNEEEAAAHFRGRPPTGFLQKPFNITELRDKVRSLFPPTGA